MCVSGQVFGRLEVCEVETARVGVKESAMVGLKGGSSWVCGGGISKSSMGQIDGETVSLTTCRMGLVYMSMVFGRAGETRSEWEVSMEVEGCVERPSG